MRAYSIHDHWITLLKRLMNIQAFSKILILHLVVAIMLMRGLSQKYLCKTCTNMHWNWFRVRFKLKSSEYKM